MSITALSGLMTTDVSTVLTICGGMIIGGSILANISFYERIKKLRKNNPLMSVFEEASRGNKKPVGVLVDKSGTMIPFVCDTSNKNKGLLDKEGYTLINPDLVKPSARARFVGTPDILFYPMPGYVPMGFHESAALIQLAKKIRKNPMLNWIPSELAVITLVFDGTGDILEDAKTIIADSIKFLDIEIPEQFTNSELFDEETDLEDLSEEQVEYMAKQLMSEVLEFRKEIKVTPIKCEPVYLSEASELCSVGMTGTSVASLLSLQEQGDRADKLDWFDKHFTKILVLAGVLIIPLLYYLVMHMAN